MADGPRAAATALMTELGRRLPDDQGVSTGAVPPPFAHEAPTAEVFNEFLDIRPAPAAQVSFFTSSSLVVVAAVAVGPFPGCLSR